MITSLENNFKELLIEHVGRIKKRENNFDTAMWHICFLANWQFSSNNLWA